MKCFSAVFGRLFARYASMAIERALVALLLSLGLSATVSAQTATDTPSLRGSELVARNGDIIKPSIVFTNSVQGSRVVTVQFDLPMYIPSGAEVLPPEVSNGRLVSFGVHRLTGAYRLVVAPNPTNDPLNNGTIVRWTASASFQASWVPSVIGDITNVVFSDSAGGRINPARVTPVIIFNADNTSADTDGDGMPDSWELIHGLKRLDPSDASVDLDGDRLTNAMEYQYKTDPHLFDSDMDGIPDYTEITRGLDPADGSDGIDLGWLSTSDSFSQYPPGKVGYDYSGLIAVANNSGNSFTIYESSENVTPQGPRLRAIDKSGAQLWSRAIGDAPRGEIEPFDIAFQKTGPLPDAYGNVYVVGRYLGTGSRAINFDYPYTTNSWSTVVLDTEYTFFVAAYSVVDGRLWGLWSGRAPIQGVSFRGLAVHPNGTAYTTWTHSGSAILSYTGPNGVITNVDINLAGTGTYPESISIIEGNSASPIVISGYVGETALTSSSFVARFTLSGYRAFEKRFGPCGVTKVAGNGSLGYVLALAIGGPCDVDRDTDGGYLVPEAGTADIFVVGYANSNNERLWTTRVVLDIPSLGPVDEYLSDVKADGHSILVGGSVNVGTSNYVNGYLARLRADNGALLWDAAYWGRQNGNVGVKSVGFGQDQNEVYFGGDFSASSYFSSSRIYYASDTDLSSFVGKYSRIPNGYPVASATSVETVENLAVSGAMRAADPDGDPLHFSITANPSFGSVNVDQATGQFTYTPNQDYTGNDNFTFVVTDDLGGFSLGRVDVSIKGLYNAFGQPNDLDGDTMYDVWEIQYGTNPLSRNDAVLDVDGDGISNLVEFQRWRDSGTDPNGQSWSAASAYAWTTTFGGNYDQHVGGVATDKQGFVYVASSYSTGVLENRIHVKKYAPDGVAVWTYEIKSDAWVGAAGIAVDNLGGVYLTGNVTGVVEFAADAKHDVRNAFPAAIFLTRLDARTGGHQWTKVMAGSYSGGYGWDVAIDASGNVYLAGYFHGEVDFDGDHGVFTCRAGPLTQLYFDSFSGGGFVSMYNANGAHGWTRYLSSHVDARHSGDVRSLVIDGSEVVAVGQFNGAIDLDSDNAGGEFSTGRANGSDGFVARFSTGGAYRSGYVIHGADSAASVLPASVALDSSGNLYLTGGISGVVDFDPGTAQAALPGSGGQDVFVLSLDRAGTYRWGYRHGGAGSDSGNAVAVDDQGRVLVSGVFQDSIDLNPGTGVRNVTLSAPAAQSNPHTMTYITRFAADGAYQGSWYANGAGKAASSALATDAMGNVYVASEFRDSLNFNPEGAGDVKLSDNSSSSYNYDIALTKFKSNTSGVDVAPIAVNADVAVGANQISTFRLSAFDVEQSTLTFILVASGSNGTATLVDGGKGLVTYTPNANFVGSDTISFKANDGIHDSNVATVNLSVSSGVVAANAVTIDVDAGNAYDGTLSATTTAGIIQSFEITSSPSHGSITNFNAQTGSFQYTPDAPYAGPDQFSFRATNGMVFSAAAQVTLAVKSGANTDGDAMIDAWEQQYFGNLSRDGNGDYDLDSVLDRDEFTGTTNPLIANNGKTIPNHDYLWSRTTSGNAYEYASRAAVDAAGNVYLSGYFFGPTDFDPTAGLDTRTTPSNYNNAFVTKLNADGSYGWTWTPAQQTSSTWSNGMDVAVDATGNVYVTGGFGGQLAFDAQNTSHFMVTANTPAVGQIYLATLAGNDGHIANLQVIGNGTSGGRGMGVQVDPTGALYLTGYFGGSAVFDPAGAEGNLSAGTASSDRYAVFITRFNANGSYAWTRFAKSTTGTSGGYAYGIDADVDSVVVTGQFFGTFDFDGVAANGDEFTSVRQSGYDGFVAEWNTTGAFIRNRQIHGVTNTASVWPRDVAYAMNGDVYVTGAFKQQTDFDPTSTNGDKRAPQQTVNEFHGFVTKINANGTYGWTNTYGNVTPNIGSFSSQGTSVTVKYGRVYVGGAFSGTTDFDPTSSTDERYTRDAYTPVIASYDSAGAYLGAWTPVGAYGDYYGTPRVNNGGFVYGLAAANDRIYAAGYYVGALNFNPTGIADVRVSVATSGGAASDDVLVVALSYPVAANTAPDAQGATIDGTVNTVLTGQLSATDADGGALTYRIVTQPTSGTLELLNATTGEFSYTPALDVFGTLSFTFVANDGVFDSAPATVTLRLYPIGDLDKDWLLDSWETFYFGDTSHDGAADSDGDGVTDANEFIAGSDPTVNDTGIASNVSYQQSTESDGLIVVEAESYHAQWLPNAKLWSTTAQAWASNGVAVEALSNAGTTRNADYLTASPRLDFQVNFVKTGTHYVWIRGLAPADVDDTMHLGLDGAAVTTSDRIWLKTPAVASWTRDTMDTAVATINVTTTGIHTINVWMREDGLQLDKLLVTTNSSYVPQGMGPSVSVYGTAGGAAAGGATGSALVPVTSGAAPAQGIAGSVTAVAGVIAVEAEHYAAHTVSGTHYWEVISVPDASSARAMQVNPDIATNADLTTVGTARLDYRVTFPVAGTYYVWLRGRAGNDAADTVNVGLDGTLMASKLGYFGNAGYPAAYGNWYWSSRDTNSAVMTLTVQTSGVHLVNVWMREDGFVFDKMVLTADSAYRPQSYGAAEGAIGVANIAPVATDGSAAVIAGSEVSGSLVATDGDGNALTYSIVTPPTKGSVVMDNAETGAYTYTANWGESGADTFTFKANDGSVDSNTATVTVTVTLPVAATPTITPASGTYANSASISISTATVGATIRYTTDGSDPQATSTVYSGPFVITASAAVKAIAQASGYADSGVASADYTIRVPQLTAVTVTPATASIQTDQTQQFTAAGFDQYGDSYDATYTWSVNSPSAAITSGGLLSATAAGTYTVAATSGAISGTAQITATLPPPVLTTIAVTSTLASVTNGQTLQFAAQGKDQYGDNFAATMSWSVSGGGTISSGGLFTAMTVGGPYTVTASSGGKSGTAQVSVAAATASMPVISPNGGSYLDAAQVTLWSATSGASIYYTVDGTTPTTSSTLYSAPFMVTTTTTVKAIAVKSGLTTSGLASATLTVTSTALKGPYSQDTSTDKLVVIEAENYDTALSRTNTGTTWSWVPVATTGSSGTGAMQATPNSAAANGTTYATLSPRLDYEVNFNTSGTHYVWVRALGATTSDDTVTIGQNGVRVSTAENFNVTARTSLGWFNLNPGATVRTISVPKVGVHTLNLWMAEDGLVIDRILITTNSAYVPSGAGPTSSVRGTTTTSLVPRGALWKYLDDGSNQGTAWKATSFADSAWKTGYAELGWGDGYESTAANSTLKPVTTYFRKSFNVLDKSKVTALALNLMRDDGAVVYLNGTEIHRNNMPAGTPTNTTLASAAVADGAAEWAIVSPTTQPSSTLLVNGTNVLAVEVHQNTTANVDMSFDASLVATVTAGGGGGAALAAPTISPNGGTLIGNATATISGPVGATIQYTLDGSDPATSGVAYTAAINLMSDTTVRAIAVKSGSINSTVTTATFTILVDSDADGLADNWEMQYFGSLAQTAAGDADADGFTNLTEQTNGTDPTQAPPPAEAPTMSPAGGSFANSVSVTLATVSTGASIYYTTNGTTPTTSSTLYTAPLVISSNVTLRAIAAGGAFGVSPMTAATFNVAPAVAVAAPTLTPAGGSYTSAVTVSLGTLTTGATLRYTTDGSTPTTSSALYSAPFTVSTSATVKAIAQRSGYADSSVASATYTIAPAAASTPVISPNGGSYTDAAQVTLWSATSGAAIYYTADGSTPTTSSTLYSAPFTVTTTTTVKAIAVKSGLTTSGVSSATLTVTSTALKGPYSQDTSTDKLVVIEAENYDAALTRTNAGTTWSWVPVATTGSSGTGAMQAMPNSAAANGTTYATLSPRMDYEVNFNTSGTHYVWVRALGATTSDDTVTIGLNGVRVSTAENFNVTARTSLGWFNLNPGATVRTISVPKVGVHTLNLWMAEDGLVIDRILITTNSAYVPSGSGPTASTRGTTTTSLVPRGALWKYLDDGSNQGTAWKATSFADSAWKTGYTELGWGDGYESTAANATLKPVTTYFRKSFNVLDKSKVTALALNLMRDDGAVVYLNGTEIHRNNMPAGTPTNTTLASAAVADGAAEWAIVSPTTQPSPTLLVNGTNVLAVEVHQNTTANVDMSFDASLIATMTTTVSPPPATLATPTIAPNGGSFTGSTSVTLSGEAGATLKYTLDGSDPVSAGATYSAPISVSSDATVRVVAIKAGSTNSAIATAVFTKTVDANDTDADGLPDAWERTYFGVLTQNPLDDFDGDGVNNQLEYQDGTVPTVNNTTGVLMQAELSLYYVDSQETQTGTYGDGLAVNAIDGNVNTFWQTENVTRSPYGPHEIQLDLGGTYAVNGFTYLPRPTSSGVNGDVADYEVYVSDNGIDWMAVAVGTWPADKTLKTVTFSPVYARFVRLRALSEINGNPWADAAEINVTAMSKPDASVVNANYALRINAGDYGFVTNDGNVWIADEGFYNTGASTLTLRSVANTVDDSLYQSARVDAVDTVNMSYRVKVPNGTYTVKLHFVEMENTTIGRRVFNVAIEGAPVLQSFDILSEAARDTALVKTFNVNVTDGVVDVDFTRGSTDVPTISGVEVVVN